MLGGVLFLALIVAVGVLITVDVWRTPTEAPAPRVDRHVREGGRAMAARGGPGIHAFSREPAVRDQPTAAAAPAARLGAGAASVDSFERPGHATRSFDQTPQPAAGDEAVRGKFNTMYVNLSRRSQALVERQLRLIEGLEHGERDQHRLASLSKLNRIAMRMHRNSQNLLVLAGQEQATNWNQPVTLAHLVEAALAEVEDYERVSYEIQPDIAVRGPAVHDAVHLLVELMDNATSFSAAEMPVLITGRILTSGGALIDITDRGIGMAAKEMAFANQQLDNPPAPDIDVPKWMGLLVVARLAARHGIRVRLTPAEAGGLTALVWFPDEILTHYAAADPGYAAGPRGAVAGPTAFAAARMNTPDATPTRAEPAWSPRTSPIPAEPLTAARLAARPEAQAADPGAIMPQAETQAAMRTLPIFQDVESRWPRGAHEAPSPAPQPGGLPRRPPASSAGPRATPGTPSGLPSRSPGRQNWAVPPEEASPDEP